MMVKYSLLYLILLLSTVISEERQELEFYLSESNKYINEIHNRISSSYFSHDTIEIFNNIRSAIPIIMRAKSYLKNAESFLIDLQQKDLHRYILECLINLNDAEHYCYAVSRDMDNKQFKELIDSILSETDKAKMNVQFVINFLNN